MNFTAKAYLFDVDKTLTNSKKQVTPETRHALQHLTEKGIRTGVCTGRNFATLSGLLQSVFPLDAVHIVCGGAQIITGSGEVKYERLLDVSLVEKLILLGEQEDSRLIVESALDLYGNAKARSYQTNYALEGQQPVSVRPLNELAVDTVPLISINDVSDALIEQILKLPVSVKLMTNYQGKRYVDITAKGVDKATAVLQWCNLLSLRPDEVIGFGDGLNDIEFLDTVGFAVAMDNAPDEVKRHADVIAPDCDRNGVALWIEENL